MKLILKRVGDDPRDNRMVAHSRVVPSSHVQDSRPFALCTEDGQQLPCQVSTCMTSNPDSMVKLTVVFEVNGRDLIVEGDATPPKE